MLVGWLCNAPCLSIFASSINSSGISLGNPQHLNLTSSFTFECWLLLNNTSMVQPAPLLSKGGGIMRLFMAVDRRQVMVEHAGNTQTLRFPSELSSWTHIALVADSIKASFELYVNGVSVRKRVGARDRSALAGDWKLGSAALNGNVAEVRLWNRALSPLEIMNCRDAQIAELDSLVGYWPLDDGAGMVVRDLSPFKNDGRILGDTQWVDAPRPVQRALGFPVVTQTAAKFHRDTLSRAVFYANGEVLAILYPPKLSQALFSSPANSGVYQLFSLATGEQLEECPTSALEPIAASFAPDASELYLFQQVTNTAITHRYRLIPPLVVSNWRAALLDQDNGRMEEKSASLRISDLRVLFPLPSAATALSADGREANATKGSVASPTGLNLAEDEDYAFLLSTLNERYDGASPLPLASTPSLSSTAPADTKLPHDPDTLGLGATITAIMGRLDEDCNVVSQMQVAKASSNLTFLMAVDMSSSTFEHLLVLLENLSKLYLNPLENVTGSAHLEPEPRQALLNFVFYTCLRLLRINIEHMVAWNVESTLR